MRIDFVKKVLLNYLKIAYSFLARHRNFPCFNMENSLLNSNTVFYNINFETMEYFFYFHSYKTFKNYHEKKQVKKLTLRIFC